VPNSLALLRLVLRLRAPQLADLARRDAACEPGRCALETAARAGNPAHVECLLDHGFAARCAVAEAIGAGQAGALAVLIERGMRPTQADIQFCANCGQARHILPLLIARGLVNRESALWLMTWSVYSGETWILEPLITLRGMPPTDRQRRMVNACSTYGCFTELMWCGCDMLLRRQPPPKHDTLLLLRLARHRERRNLVGARQRLCLAKALLQRPEQVWVLAQSVLAHIGEAASVDVYNRSTPPPFECRSMRQACRPAPGLTRCRNKLSHETVEWKICLAANASQRDAVEPGHWW